MKTRIIWKKCVRNENLMVSMIIHPLDERIPKGDIKMKGNKYFILES
jgi:hypothetical protein